MNFINKIPLNISFAILPPSLLVLISYFILIKTNYLIFHVFTEFFSIVIALTTLTIAISANQLIQNGFIIFIAVTSGWCGCLDLLHVLVYEGMSLLDVYGPNKSTQIWVTTRLIQSLAFLIAPIFLRYKCNLFWLNTIFGFLSALLLWCIFSDRFPITYIDGQGLTLFKQALEFTVIGILMITIVIYKQNRHLMSNALYFYLLASILAMIVSEFFFASYFNMYGSENVIGHILKIYTYWFIYAALVDTTLKEPFNALSRSASTYDAIPDPTLVIDRDGKIRQINQAALTIYNLRLNELLGREHHGYFHNKKLSTKQCPVCKQINTEKKPFTLEIETGFNKWSECSLSPIASSVFPTGWVEVIRDITSRKRLEIERNNLVTNLTSRLKELSCLYAISNLSTSKNLTIQAMLDKTRELLPLAFKQPDKIIIKIQTKWGDFSYGEVKNCSFILEREILVHGESFGKLLIYYHGYSIESFEENEIKLVDVVVQQIADMISSILSLEKIKQLSYLYELLSNTNRAAVHCKGAEELLASVFDSLIKFGSFKILFAATLSNPNLSYIVRYYHGIHNEQAKDIENSINISNTGINKQLTQLLVGDVVEISSQHWGSDAWAEYLKSINVRFGFLLPLKLADNLYGIIGIYGDGAEQFIKEQKTVLNQIAQDASFALAGYEATKQQLAAEKKVILFEQKFSDVFMSSPLPMQILSKEKNQILNVNNAFEQWLGYTEAELISDPNWIKNFFEKTSPSFEEIFNVGDLDNTILEITLITRSNKIFIARVSKVILTDTIILFWTDLTDIRKNEQRLKDRERHLQTIIDQPIAGIYIRNETKFLYTNKRFSDIVGRTQEELTNLNLIDILGENEEAKQMVIANWLEIKNHPLGSISYSLPLTRKDGKKIILNLHASNFTWYGEPAVIAVVQDVTELEYARRDIERYVKQLEKAINNTFLAVSHMVEFRDPYTAGHERKVGMIARAIAEEMGLPEKKCQSIELMGFVHDLGKISVPAEILSKPGSLTETEMNLVKDHARVGYDILKDIEFDMPVAEVIWQHHERIDGSGYPQGLKGDAILLEARIIAVADVLESMSSHRPYRPALGLEAALEELIKNRGILYDADAVDACLNLIKNKNYNLPT